MSEIDWDKAPEGATHWELESYGASAGWMRNDGGDWFFLSSEGRWLKHIISNVSAVRLANMIERPPTPWSGEGLPPVGAVCEAFYMGQPQGVVIVRYSGQCMILWSEDRVSEQCGQADHYLFKPIRTKEQIAADEREVAISEIISIITREGAFDIDDPEVKASAIALYRAGYRKQDDK